jgi:manganese/iron transport system substrate-binding protein
MLTKKISVNNYLHTAYLALTIGLIGCTNQTSTNYNQTTKNTQINPNLPQVVVTNSVLCDLTKQVAGDTIQLYCLIPPNEETRFYKPKPEDSQMIEKADLILYHGYNLEPSLINIIKINKNSVPKIAVGQTAVKNPQKLKRNNKSFVEPHIWHNPKNAIKMVEVINNNLKKISPKNSKIYNNNTQTITTKLTQLDKWIWLRLSSIPPKNRKIAITHEAMLYFAKAYKIPYNAALMGISEPENFTAKQVKTLAANLQKSKPRTIFVDNTTNPDVFAPIAKAANVQIFSRQLYIDGLGAAGSEAETYQKMIEANTRTIVEGLGGTYIKFEPQTAR